MCMPWSHSTRCSIASRWDASCSNVCTNLSCRLRGADQIVDCIRRRLSVEPGQTTADDKFTLGLVECLASCGTAPMLQLNQDAFHENLTVEKTLKLIDELNARDD